MAQSYFFIRTDRQYVKIKFSDIIYIEACQNYVALVTDKGTHMSLLSMKQLDRILPKHQFCRVHRSCIVSIERVLSFDHDTVHLEGKTIPMGERYRKQLEQRVIIVTSEVRDNRHMNSVKVMSSMLEVN